MFRSPPRALLILALSTAPWSLTGCGGGGTTPPTAPAAVAGFTASSGFGLVELSWDAPVSTGGSAITTYRIYRGELPETLTQPVDVPVDCRSYQDASGAIGTTYYFAVAAANAVGEGPLSDVQAAAPLEMPVAPGPVLNATASAGDGIAAVGWLPPLSEGSSPVTGYRILRGDAPGDLSLVATLPSTAGLYLDSAVANGSPVYYAVAAVSVVGTGPMSDPLTATPRTGTYYGLFVGIDNYDPSYISPASALAACVNDAHGVRNSLLKDSTRWTAERALILTDGEATLAAVRGSLATLADLAQPGDTVMYHQSGHGGRHGTSTESFVCCFDGSYEDYELAMDLSTFRAGVRVVLTIDTCHSGGLFKDESFLAKALPGGDAPAGPWRHAANVMAWVRDLTASTGPRAKGVPEPEALGPDVGWITAADYDQYAWDDVPYGLFTGYMVDAFILGDANEDGLVSADELARYVSPRAVKVDTDVQTWGEPVLAVTMAAATGSRPAPDAYEPDDTRDEAQPLVPGVPQIRTLHTSDDHDWVSFTLTGSADAVLETGPVDGWGGDTVVTVYTATGTLVGSDDDSGSGFYSRLSGPLPAGDYVAEIRVPTKDGVLSRPIEGYTLSLAVTPAGE